MFNISFNFIKIFSISSGPADEILFPILHKALYVSGKHKKHYHPNEFKYIFADNSRHMPLTPEEDISFISQSQFQLINEPEAKFILEHAEKQLKDILDTSLQIVARSTTLLTIIVGVMIALIGFSIQNWETTNLWSQKLFIALWFTAYLGVIVFILFFNFIPKTYFIAGAEPADFFKSDEVFRKENSDYRMIAILVNEIIQAQLKIKRNKLANDKKWRNFNWAIYLIGSIPIYILIIYWVSTFQFLNLT